MDILNKLDRFPRIDLRAIPDDLRLVVDSKIATLSYLSTNVQNEGAELLLDGAGRTFLWVSIVLKHLSDMPFLSLAKLKNIIKSSPTDLEKLYQSIVDRVMRASKASK
ncbi:hypothetical protein FGG08_004503 [Glutinoglossum americanum]|uniref:Uncharacterized protein n=1 Tax=Glutinoglossum americanum TaxID=1670608 RepID=A0A9P8I4X7_9PEZI|nr:hypothetical protein FGG08_004503 [Glutinoglossum americanum]